MKNTLDEFNGRLDIAGGWKISELEETAIETFQKEIWRVQTSKKRKWLQ